METLTDDAPTIASTSVAFLPLPQRRCQGIADAFPAGATATVEIFSALNGVDDDTAQRYH